MLPLLIPVEVRTRVPTRIALSNSVFSDSPDTLSFFDKDGNYTGDQLNGVDKMNTPLGLNFGYTEESDENQIRTPFAEDKELVESISYFDKDGNFTGDQ